MPRNIIRNIELSFDVPDDFIVLSDLTNSVIVRILQDGLKDEGAFNIAIAIEN